MFILPLFPSFFTPPLPLSSVSHQVSHRECVTTLWIWGSSPNVNFTKQCYQSIRNDCEGPIKYLIYETTVQTHTIHYVCVHVEEEGEVVLDDEDEGGVVQVSGCVEDLLTA